MAVVITITIMIKEPRRRSLCKRPAQCKGADKEDGDEDDTFLNGFPALVPLAAQTNDSNK